MHSGVPIVIVMVSALTASGCGRVGYEGLGALAEGDGGSGDRDGGAEIDDGGSGPLGTEANIAFVSSIAIIPGELGGTEGADRWCTDLANNAGHDGRYVAWLSSTTSNVIDRLGMARGWQRPDGLLLVNQSSEFGEGGLLHALNQNELGGRTEGAVATASHGDGTVLISLGQFSNKATCDDFTNPATATGVEDGYTNLMGTQFSTGFPIGGLPCDFALPLYCFGVSNRSSQSLPAPAGRLAFISEAGWVPGGGFSGADALCQGEADVATLPGTYRALLAGTSSSAGSRFDLAGAPWYRVDGARLAATPMAFMLGELDSTVSLTAEGMEPSGSRIWTGYGLSSPDAATGVGVDTCQDWNNGSGNQGGVGTTIYAGALMFIGSSMVCSASFHLVCLQE